MKNVLEHIEARNRRLADHPLLAFLSNVDVEPNPLVKIAPFMAPLVMGAQDLFTDVLVEPNAEDPYQKTVNLHCKEDEGHWKLYIADIRALSSDDEVTDLASAFELVWGDRTKGARKLLNGLIAKGASADAKMRLVIVESLEAPVRVTWRHFIAASARHAEASGKALRYFGGLHLQLETDHDAFTASTAAFVESIIFTHEEAERAKRYVDEIFDSFHAWYDELLVNGQTDLR